MEDDSPILKYGTLNTRTLRYSRATWRKIEGRLRNSVIGGGIFWGSGLDMLCVLY